MATNDEAAAPHDDKCANCGACKHCGNGGVKFVPYPVYPYPYALPYRPYFQPTWVSPNTNPYYTSIQAQGPNQSAAGGTWQSNTFTTGGNYAA